MSVDPRRLDHLRTVFGDPKLLLDLLDGFEQETKRGIAAIRAAIAGKDAPKLTSAAHRLKSASANMGADVMTQILVDLEKAGNEDRIDTTGTLLEKLESESEIVSRALKAAFSA